MCVWNLETQRLSLNRSKITLFMLFLIERSKTDVWLRRSRATKLYKRNSRKKIFQTKLYIYVISRYYTNKNAKISKYNTKIKNSYLKAKTPKNWETLKHSKAYSLHKQRPKTTTTKSPFPNTTIQRNQKIYANSRWSQCRIRQSFPGQITATQTPSAKLSFLRSTMRSSDK